MVAIAPDTSPCNYGIPNSATEVIWLEFRVDLHVVIGLAVLPGERRLEIELGNDSLVLNGGFPSSRFRPSRIFPFPRIERPGSCSKK
jgi:hypothetical protein